MGIFEESISKKDFEIFKKEILKEIGNLKEEVNHTASDSEENIKKIESNVETLLATIKEKESEIERYLTTIKTSSNASTEEADKIKIIFQEMNTILSTLNENLEATDEYKTSIFDKKEKIDDSVEDIENKITSINESLEISNTLPSELESVQKLLTETTDIYNSIEGLKNHSLDRKSEIDKLYKEIYGEDITNEENEDTEHIDGLRDKLKKSYIEISKSIEILNNTVNESIEDEKKSFDELLSTSEHKINDVKATLDSLLPGAMSAGLSSAYEKKTDDEKTAKESLETSFRNSVFFLVAVSLLPVGIDVYLFTNGSELIQVIKDTPNLILSIFPIYLPILWYAYSSSKKLNLSKRLIEEYTHKASLGKTFEGLSTQIESLSDSDVRDELRSKLLFNLLNASAENPGELIKDYQKSDHPIMEALNENPITSIFKNKSEKNTVTSPTE